MGDLPITRLENQFSVQEYRFGQPNGDNVILGFCITTFNWS